MSSIFPYGRKYFFKAATAALGEVQSTLDTVNLRICGGLSARRVRGRMVSAIARPVWLAVSASCAEVKANATWRDAANTSAATSAVLKTSAPARMTSCAVKDESLSDAYVTNW